MTERKQNRAIAQFYDALADDFERMTTPAQRAVAEGPFLRLLHDRYRIRTAVDAGAGTGFHSLLLSQMEIQVTAVDLSREMLSRLRRRGAKLGLKIRTIRSSFGDLPEKLGETVDAVFCMGNSLAHLLEEKDLTESLRSFARVLRPGGLLFAQMLNYHHGDAQGERILSVREEGGSLFIRISQRRGRSLELLVLKLEQVNSTWRASLRGIPLRPWVAEDLKKALSKSGFKRSRFFGTISMEPFEPLGSRDLVILARRHE